MKKWLFFLFSMVSKLFAQGIGAPLIPAEPCGHRLEFDVGASRIQFSRFRYGDVREDFPVDDAPALGNALDERPHETGCTFGIRGSFAVSPVSPWAPLELWYHGGYYNLKHHASFLENGPNIVFVPYIDALIRPDLTGGSVVGLFLDSEQELNRQLVCYEIEVGIRQPYYCGCWSLSPGFFFAYERLEQKDRVSTLLITNPTQHDLWADLNSNNYVLGASLSLLGPIYQRLFYVANVAGGLQIATAHYKGRQEFPDPSFTAFEQLALANDHHSRFGGSVAFETGFVVFCFGRTSLALLGNLSYLSAFPHVIYPTPIDGTDAVTDPAHIGWKSQFNYGAAFNIGVSY